MSKWLWILQADYGYGHGWEDETAEESRDEIDKRWREYIKNAPQYKYRIVKKRDNT